MATPFPTIPISQSSSMSMHNEINAIRFGNGYEQRVPMGINYRRETWNIVWDALTLPQKNTIVNFIQSVSNGSTILWTPPNESAQKRYVLDGDWSLVNRGGTIYSINLKMRQVFDLT